LTARGVTNAAFFGGLMLSDLWTGGTCYSYPAWRSAVSRRSMLRRPPLASTILRIGHLRHLVVFAPAQFHPPKAFVTK